MLTWREEISMDSVRGPAHDSLIFEEIQARFVVMAVDD
jgi:hypothetical protein